LELLLQAWDNINLGLAIAEIVDIFLAIDPKYPNLIIKILNKMDLAGLNIFRISIFTKKVG
jgi:hypothetical protein